MWLIRHAPIVMQLRVDIYLIRNCVLVVIGLNGYLHTANWLWPNIPNNYSQICTLRLFATASHHNAILKNLYVLVSVPWRKQERLAYLRQVDLFLMALKYFSQFLIQQPDLFQ